MMVGSNHILAVSLQTDSLVVASTLESAKRNSELTEIAFHAVSFDALVNAKFKELLRRNDQRWKKVEFINCMGDLEAAVDAAIVVDQVEAIYIVRNLETFNVSNNFGTLLGSSSSLRRLRLTTALEEEVAVGLSLGLAKCRSLRAVDFRWTTFQAGSIGELVKCFTKNKDLEEVDFFGCELTDSDISAIASAFICHPNLKNLLLNGNQCCFLGSKCIGKIIERPDCQLSKVDLSFQRLKGEAKLDISYLMKAMKVNRSLQTLDMTCSGLDDSDAVKIAEAMEQNDTLRELFLARNKFTDDGISVIATRLPRMKGLKKLSLWGNPFGEKGARELLSGVTDNVELQDLHLFRRFECSDKIQYLTNMNRGGRKLLQEAPNDVPIALWPRVLARANTMKMPPRRKLEDFEMARIDMLYFLVRGPVLLARGLGLADQRIETPEAR